MKIAYIQKKEHRITLNWRNAVTDLINFFSSHFYFQRDANGSGIQDKSEETGRLKACVCMCVFFSP